MASSSTTEKSLILDDANIRRKIHRIAYEIYESNFDQKKLVVVGIDARGGFLARALVEKLEEISGMEIAAIPAVKNEASDEIKLEAESPAKLIRNRAVVIVDDVLYSGHTMFYAIASVMAHKPLRVQTAVLIDRGHRSVPVRPDFVGVVLATTLKQHVSVEVNKGKQKVEAFLL